MWLGDALSYCLACCIRRADEAETSRTIGMLKMAPATVYSTCMFTYYNDFLNLTTTYYRFLGHSILTVLRMANVIL